MAKKKMIPLRKSPSTGDERTTGALTLGDTFDAEPRRDTAAVPVNVRAIPPTATTNYYERYGQETSSTMILGDLLKFTKTGAFVAGRYEDDVPLGTRLVALMPSLCVGWVHWEDGRPIETIMGPVGQGYRPVSRETLAPTDEAEWPTDDDGKALDPWQRTSTLVLVDPEDPERIYTYSTSSKGGKDALGELAKNYGKRDRMEPGAWQPIVELGRGSYQHPRREYGRIQTPVLKVVGWIPTSDLPPIEGLPEDWSAPALPPPATP